MHTAMKLKVPLHFFASTYWLLSLTSKRFHKMNLLDGKSATLKIYVA